MDEFKMEDGFLPTNPIKTSLQNQIIASFICNLGVFAFGCSLGWLSPVLDDLQKKDGGPLEFPMTELEVAWAGGLLCLGALIGQPIFNYVAKTKGRKPSVYTAGIPMAVAALIKMYGSTSNAILISQFFIGIGGAGALALPTLYVSEICEPRARGAISSIIVVQYSFGVFASYVLGAILPYDILNAIQLAPPILSMVAFWFMPETPLFRLKKGDEEAAARAVAWLRKIPLNGADVRMELVSLARQLRGAEPLDTAYEPTKDDLAREMEWITIKNQQHPVLIQKKYPGGITPEELEQAFRKKNSWKLLFSSRAAVRGLIICLAQIACQTFMGLSAISVYASVVFDAVHLKISSDICSIIYSVILMIGCTLGTLMMDFVGRRVLQIGSCFIVAVGELILGVFFYISSNDYAPDWMAWIALIALTVSVITYNAGPSPIVFVFLTEYFAAEVRDLANTIVMVFMWVSGFGLMMLFSPSVSIFGIANVFFFFAIMSFITGILSFIFLPETKGKTQDEILQILEKGIYYK